jgi:hypothetical protein
MEPITRALYEAGLALMDLLAAMTEHPDWRAHVAEVTTFRAYYAHAHALLDEAHRLYTRVLEQDGVLSIEAGERFCDICEAFAETVHRLEEQLTSLRALQGRAPHVAPSVTRHPQWN